MPGKHLTEKQRYQLEALLKAQGKQRNISLIARTLKCSRTTIYREIKRGTVEQLTTDLKLIKVYLADYAQEDYRKKETNKGREYKIANDLAFVQYVEKKILNDRYSPDAILMDIQRKGLSFQTKVCCSTLYSYIHKGVFLNVTGEDLSYRKKKKKQRKIVRISHKKPTKPSIEDRPAEIDCRENYGHWEMDTVYSSHKNKDKSCLLVLTERKEKDEIIIKLKNRKAESVVKAVDRMYRSYGKKRFQETFKSITVDNGSEFMDYENMVRNNRFEIYFCHPFCSGERGTNENSNKLIRRWIPKGKDISSYTNAEIKEIEKWMNDYPRRSLGGHSSNDIKKLC